ncbi:MAG: S1 RNA-binding domain-containing protein [Candidatus Fimenecus sp.]
MKTYLPEGILFVNAENQQNISSFSRLREAFYADTVLEARAVRCDRDHNLHIDLGGIDGFMPREECALGIAEGAVRDIAVISRVNKPVCFKILSFHDDENGNRTAVLSRRAVQAECRKQYLQKLRPGDVIDAVITRLEPFGAFCDVGAGLPALLPIDSISVSRIPHPSARFFVGQQIRAVLKSVDEAGRITLSHKELLGTWAENAARFSAGETVSGVVRSVEKYGIFVELAPNLAGLTEYVPGVAAGDTASVFIKSINPARLKIKLILVDRFPPAAVNYAFPYPDISHIDRWQYSPDGCEKQIETVFSK